MLHSRLLILSIILIIQILNFHAIQSNNEEISEPLKDEELLELIETFAKNQNNTNCSKSVECAIDWISRYDYIVGKVYEKFMTTQYNFMANMTEENQILNSKYVVNKLIEATKETLLDFKKNLKTNNETLNRLIKSAIYLSHDGEDGKELNDLINESNRIYATAKSCKPGSNVCLSLDPELNNLFKNSRYYDELLMHWKGWHDATGPKIKENFAKIVTIKNETSRKNGYNDTSEYWMEEYEVDDFEKLMDNLYNQIKPLYEQLHAYIRRKLNSIYSKKYPSSHNPKLIPAHLLGSVLADSWENIYDLLIPYPEQESLNLTDAIIKKNYTPILLVKEAENFFKSMGMLEMTPFFWNRSIFTKQKDTKMLCHAFSFDFYNEFDYRIKMCAESDYFSFYVIHHEMGHIEYMMAYKNQPNLFKSGANPAFHEAIGETIGLSVFSPKHLNTIGLIKNGTLNKEQEINFLLKTSLQKIAPSPFTYLVDKWRWNVFRGKIKENEYNTNWWKMRELFQGLEAPINRSEADFDPGAQYHISSFFRFSQYFVANFIEFQAYKALCGLSDHVGPLYNCDFYNSKKAGAKLKEVLELGMSKHWIYSLFKLTGETEITSNAILEYFQPLYDWLIEENSKYPNDKPGW